LLPGITRQVILELAASLGIATAENEVRLADLNQFEEAFLTNSLIEVIPLAAIRDDAGKAITIGSGKPGPVTRRLTTAYQQMVKQYTAR